MLKIIRDDEDGNIDEVNLRNGVVAGIIEDTDDQFAVIVSEITPKDYIMFVSVLKHDMMQKLESSGVSNEEIAVLENSIKSILEENL